MALRLTLAALPRLPAPGCARSLCTRSCSPGARAPCAPCAPAPRPACRARPETRARALRRVCCPPPAGHPPPCGPPPCATPLSCSDPPKMKKRIVPVESINCEADRDAVAVRLALAERARRLEYEQEARTRAKRAARPPPREPYALGAERECARATDGRNYTLSCARRAPPPCGPGRTPPPDRCVEIIRDNDCTIRDGDHVDPCAHLPRTLVEIDRSASAPSHADAAPPARNLTSRIIESLSFTRSADATGTCPRPSCDPKCETTGAKKAGDFDWCKNLTPPGPVAPACRKPTPMEKLKRRGPARCSEISGPPSKRSFHSCPTVFSAGTPTGKDVKKEEPQHSPLRETSIADVETLKKVLKERDALLEAGRGRVVTSRAASGKKFKKATTTQGSLNIPVPAGADSVHVHVSLKGAGARREPQTPRVSDTSTRVFEKSDSFNKQPWLSIKSLHKKIASCKKLEIAKEPMKPKKAQPSTSHPRPPPCPQFAPGTRPTPCKPAKPPSQPQPNLPKNPIPSLCKPAKKPPN